MEDAHVRRSWGTWSGPENNKYLVMKYEHGTGCWQGPNRSTTVSGGVFHYLHCVIHTGRFSAKVWLCVSGEADLWEGGRGDLHFGAESL